MSATTRYTAVVKIVRVDETPAVSGRYANQPEISPATSKDTELSSIVVRGSDLSKLLAATKAHLDLTEDVQ